MVKIHIRKIALSSRAHCISLLRVVSFKVRSVQRKNILLLTLVSLRERQFRHNLSTAFSTTKHFQLGVRTTWRGQIYDALLVRALEHVVIGLGVDEIAIYLAHSLAGVSVRLVTRQETSRVRVVLRFHKQGFDGRRLVGLDFLQFVAQVPGFSGSVEEHFSSVDEVCKISDVSGFALFVGFGVLVTQSKIVVVFLHDALVKLVLLLLLDHLLVYDFLRIFVFLLQLAQLAFLFYDLLE